MFPQAPNFSRETCLLLARAAHAAYLGPEGIAATAAMYGATFFRFIECKATGTQCFIASNGADCVIAFRGTEALRDWITDAKFRRVAWDGQSVHRGFANAYDSVHDEIVAALEEIYGGAKLLLCPDQGGAATPPHRLWITGHSLGGALATLCMWAMTRFVSGVYTFGSPRVGSAAFARSYDSFYRAKTFRVVHEEDIVCRLPGVLTGYRHVGTEIFLDSFGEMKIDLPWWKKIPSDINGLALGLDVLFPLSSTASVPLRKHKMNRYIERLEKIPVGGTGVSPVVSGFQPDTGERETPAPIFGETPKTTGQRHCSTHN